MANNAIGTGAVILTANADRLLTGLNKAEKAVEKWADRTTKRAAKVANVAGGGAGGARGGVGGLGALLGGGAGGVLGGLLGGPGFALGGSLAGSLVGSAAGRGIDAFLALPEMLKSLRDSSGQGAGGPLDRIVLSLQRFQEIGAQVLATVISPLAPAFERAADIAGHFWERLEAIAASLGGRMGGVIYSLVESTGSWLNIFVTGLEAVWPVLDRVTRAGEVLIFVAEAGAVAIADGVASAISGIAEWVGGWWDLSRVSTTVSQAMFAGLDMVGRAGAWVWDSFKLGAGIVAVSVGSVIKVVAKLADVLKTLTEGMARLGGDAARALGRGDLAVAFDLVGAAAGKLSDTVTAAGDGLVNFGMGAIADFGKTAAMIGANIDALEAKFNARAAMIAGAANVAGAADSPITKTQLSGAFAKNSVEAQSIINQFQGGNTLADSQRRIVELMRQNNGFLRQILDKMGMNLGVI